MSKYDFEMILNPDSLPMKMMSRISNASSVLEFGCAEGRMTRYMKETKECDVSIVEIDRSAFETARQYAKDGICSDIESGEWKNHFQNIRFDYILFADVLEHLRDPEQVIREAKSFLKPGGEMLISVPNIAHNDVLASLYNNHFEYRNIGLLDNTHLHFWGEKELETLAQRCGMALVILDGVCQIPFHTELPSDHLEIPESLKALLNSRDYNEVYEFLLVLTDQEWARKNGIGTENRLQKSGNLRKANFYWDTGSGYTFGNYISVAEERKQDTSIYRVGEIPAGCRKVRFDPPMEDSCIVRNTRVLADDRIECELKPLNGTVLRNGAVLFEKILGQMEFTLPEGTSFFTVKAEILPCFQEGEHQELLRERRTLSGEKERLESEYQTLSAARQGLEKDLQQLNDHCRELESRNQGLARELADQNQRFAREFESQNQRFAREFESQNQRFATEQDVLEQEIRKLTEAQDHLIREREQLEQEARRQSEGYLKASEALQESGKKNERLAEENGALSAQLEMLRLQYATISDSQFWKMTGPFRKTLDLIKRNRLGAGAHKLARSVRMYGIKGTARKIKTRVDQRKLEKLPRQEISGAESVNEGVSTAEFLQQLASQGAKWYPEGNLPGFEEKETVLLITHELSRTGAPVVLENLAERLKEQGKNPVMLSPLDGELKQTCIRNGIPVIVYPGVYHTDLVTRFRGLFRLIVISTINGGPLISRLNRTETPVIWWIHEARVSYHPGAMAGMPEEVASNIHIYCGGPYAQRILHEYYPQYQTDQLLYYVPDYASMRMKEAELPVQIRDGMTVFVCAGMMEERKGQDILTQAIHDVKAELRSKCLFIFVGGQYYKPAYDAIMACIRDFPDNVCYIPQLSREELTTLYKRMDCLVCPSRDDPLPTVATEAMSLSRLVLCSENTGTARLIEEMGSGMIYRNNDPHELAECITRIAAGQVDREQIRKNARKTYERYFSRAAFDRKIEDIYQKLVSGETLPVHDTVSVVIPCYNAGNEFPKLLSLLKGQEGIDRVEIIIVDSGSRDATVQTAREYGAKVIQIPNAEFSHSHARNLGAENASGKYVLFMTQDAMPGSTHWIRDLAQPLLGQNAAAVSCREEPRPDCDLLGRFSIWQHSKYMGILNHDRILSLPEKQNYDTMRRNAQLNDVACLVRKDVFLEFRYRGDYAEDLDLGMRMIRKGYTLALLSSAPVIHSHTRPAYYYLKRCLVDVLTLQGILPDSPMENISAPLYMNRMLSLYAAAKLYILAMIRQLDQFQDLASFTAWTQKNYEEQKASLRNVSHANLRNILELTTPYEDEKFQKFIMDLYARAGDQFAFNHDYVDVQQGMLTGTLPDYLRFTGEPFDRHLGEQIGDLVMKHCGQLAGVAYASYVFYHEKEKSFLNELAAEIRKGV